MSTRGKGLRIVTNPDDTKTQRRPPGTSTSTFGGPGVRENHDSSVFRSRFGSPNVQPAVDELRVANHRGPEGVRVGDARDTGLDDNVAALVVTSPPYFVGKEYEIDDESPQTWPQYLDWLGDVLTESHRILESGGRIAMNVPGGIGRRPYLSVSAEVIRLMEAVGFLLRGEIIWMKAEGSSSLAVGTWGSPHNPVLRDVTERIVVGSKDIYHRLGNQAQRRADGLPSESNMTSPEFSEAALDVWRIQPARASQVGHPAPFPIELPRRLIQFYTFGDDLVVDPMCGSGTTGVAALEMGRRFVGVDRSPEYVELAERRLAGTVPSLHIPPPPPATGRLNLTEAPEVPDEIAEAGEDQLSFDIKENGEAVLAQGGTGS